MRKISKKRQAQLAEYAVKRLEFLVPDHNARRCEVCKIELAWEVHHKKGRTGDLLLDERYFLAVCCDCHRKIHNEPKWAYENGYMISKIKNSRDNQEY